MFYNRVSAEADGIGNEAECADSGCDSKQEVIQKLHARIEKAI